MNTKSKPILAIGLIGVVVIIILATIGLGKKSGDHSQMGGAQDTSQGTNTNAVATDQVTIRDYSFSPATITVKVGTKVTWTNQDTVKHTVTGDDQSSGLMSQLFGKGETYSHTFDKAGTYSYFCQPHPYMKGTVIVTN